MKPSELERLPIRLEQLYREIGELMMEDIVRRIRKTGEITSTADYQIQRLVMLGATSEEIEREIQKRLKVSNSELWRLYDKVIDWEYVRCKDVYEQINSNFIPWEDNYQLQQVTHAIMENALDELKNVTRSMGFAINQGGKTVFMPMADYYQKYLDQTLLGIVTGAFDYNSALRKCVTQMTNSGIRTVDYASGHSNRIDVAARRAVMTGLSQVTGRITDYHANRLGIDTFEVAWHAGARNTGVGFYNHQNWQGKVYTRQQLIDICGLGQGGGLCGWNCYHEYYMFFPGLSKRNWSDDWLEGMNQAENIPREYNGKWYDMYAATQKQRQMETAMRAQREKVRLLQAGGADKDDILNERIKYNGQLYEYVKFSNKMNLKQQKERIYLDMRGTVGIKNISQERGISNKRIPKETDYKINRDYINSNKFKRKFNGITGDSRVDDAIYKYAKAGLIHRDGTACEDLYILSVKDGKILAKNVTSNELQGVKPNASIIRAVREHQGELIGLHTHPTSTPPTGSDFETSGYRNYNFGVVACADGSVFTYRHSKKYISKRYIDDTIEKYRKSVDKTGKKVYSNDREAHLAALEQIKKDYGIEYEER